MMGLFFKRGGSDAAGRGSAGARPNGKQPAGAPVPVNAPVPAASQVAPAKSAAEAVRPVSTQPVRLGAGIPSAIQPMATAPANTYRQDHKSLYKQLIGSLYDAVLVTDPKGHVIDSNSRVKDFFLFDKNEVWDMEIAKLIPGITRPLIERVRQGIAEGRYVLITARCVRKDGAFFAAEVSICAIDLINEGDLVFSVRNIERRKQQARMLRSLQNAVANDLAAVAVCDGEGRVTVANPALLAQWGYASEEEAIGKNLHDLFPNDPHADEPLRKALTGERWEGTLQATSRQGNTFLVQGSVNVDRGADQDVVGVVCSFTGAR